MTDQGSAGERFAGLLEILKIPAGIISANGAVTRINSAWRDFAGAAYTPGAPLLELIDPRDRQAVAALVQSATRADGHVQFDCRLCAGVGASRWFMLSLQPQPGHEGGECRWVCTATDISRLKGEPPARDDLPGFRDDLLDATADCIKLIALDGSIRYMNEAGCRSLGVARDSGFGMRWLSLLPEDVRDEGEEALAAARAGSHARFPGRSEQAGRIQLWDNALTPVQDDTGQVTAIVCTSRDVTAERVATDALKQSAERLTIAAHVGGLGIWDYDIASDEIHCDETWYRVIGRPAVPPVRSVEDFRPFIHPEDVDRAVDAQIATELVEAGRDYTIEYRIIWPNGEIRWVRSAAYLIKDVTGAPIRAVGFVTDITIARREELALRQANQVLQEESRLDSLTGIANRRHLDMVLENISAESDGSRRPVTIGMIDVDHFKAFNDRYGHPAGDEVLRRIAAAIESAFRTTDTVARYGGEEFVFVLPDGADPAAGLRRLAEAIAALAIPHDESPFGRVTVSAGAVTLCPSEHMSTKSLLAACDIALYEAKEQGRDRYVVRSTLDC